MKTEIVPCGNELCFYISRMRLEKYTGMEI